MINNKKRLEEFSVDLDSLLEKYGFKDICLEINGKFRPGYIIGVNQDQPGFLMVASNANCPCCNPGGEE